MRYLSLFTGYGGLDLAWQDIGDPIAYVEIEGYCQKIIARRMADGMLKRAPILADVKNIRGAVGICDLIIGGFPCQDLSLAGRRKGLEGERSGLFYEIIRLTKEICPTFVFIENVEGIRTKGLREVTRAFADLGYDIRWTRVSAKSVGANHRRNRFFGLAHSGDSGLWQSDKQGWITRKDRQRQADSWSNGEVQHVANAQCERLQRDSERQTQKLFVTERGDEMANSDSTRAWRLREREREESSNTIFRESSESIFKSDWWEVEPDMGRVVNGPTNRLDLNRTYEPTELVRYFRNERIKMLGNGVVPAQARKARNILLGVKEI